MPSSDENHARYNDEATLIVRQFVNESDRDDLLDLSTEVRIVAACRWVMSQHDRWSESYIRVRCCALGQRIELLRSCELIQEVEAESLLRDLKTCRPRPVGSSDRINPNRRDQKIKNGVIVRNNALRRVIKVCTDSDDNLDNWLAGLLKITSRIGWRPGETLNLAVLGRILSAPAKKYRRTTSENAGGPEQEDGFGSEDRGLFDQLEIKISERYPENVLVALQRWVEETAQWCDVYGGEAPFLAAVREQLRRRCEDAKVTAFSPYDLRHFAIACMKRSGRSREEIAAVVNHLSDRTAGEHYGKARSGIRRPRAMFSVDPDRVAFVRKSARPFPKWEMRSPKKRSDAQI